MGQYTLTIASSVADFAGNHLAAFNGSFTIALPDLAVTATTAPSSAGVGASIPVSWTVSNLSQTFPATSGWQDAVYFSSHSVLDGSSPFSSPTVPPRLSRR